MQHKSMYGWGLSNRKGSLSSVTCPRSLSQQEGTLRQWLGHRPGGSLQLCINEGQRNVPQGGRELRLSYFLATYCDQGRTCDLRNEGSFLLSFPF